MDLITTVNDILTSFGTLAGIAGLCALFSGYIITWFKVKSENRQWTSWLVSLAITAVAWVLGYYVDFGAFAGFNITDWMSWVMVAAVAVLGGLLSNGIYDIEMVKKILDWLGAFPGKPSKDNDETKDPQ